MEHLIDFAQNMDSAAKLKLLMFSVVGYMIFQQQAIFIAALKSRSWPVLEAGVIESTFDRVASNYEPRIVYRYQYRGKEYMNDTYSYMGTPFFTKNSAIEVAQDYPSGSKVNVHVDPEDPENSTVVPGVHWVQWLSAIAVLSLFLGIAFLPEILTIHEYLFPSESTECEKP